MPWWNCPAWPNVWARSSTVTGAAMLNAVVARVAELLLERTGDAPVFMSANLDGGDAHNQRWLEKYRGPADVSVGKPHSRRPPSPPPLSWTLPGSSITMVGVSLRSRRGEPQRDVWLAR